MKPAAVANALEGPPSHPASTGSDPTRYGSRGARLPPPQRSLQKPQQSLLTAGCMVTNVSRLPEEPWKVPVAKNGRPHRPHITQTLHRQRHRTHVFLDHFVAQPPQLSLFGRNGRVFRNDTFECFKKAPSLLLNPPSRRQKD
ncbi:hypothetical protein MTO96_042562 [Rhipicephalus appendiculatus]